MKHLFFEKIEVLLVAAFGFVTALAWNSAVQSLFLRVFGENEGLVAMFTYALFVTILAVFVTLWMGKAKKAT